MIVGFVKMEVIGYFVKNYLGRVVFRKLTGMGCGENGNQSTGRKIRQ